jgi:2-polyprenyl-3-methyl-5-hydroxy-6-metoxy-1,4-benzoquinol methylase
MFLAKNGFRTSGIDVSNKAIELAKSSDKRRRLRIDFRTGTVLYLPCHEKEFVFLNDRGCLHNLELDEWSDYASEVARVAKPSAYFLLRGASNK